MGFIKFFFKFRHFLRLLLQSEQPEITTDTGIRPRADKLREKFQNELEAVAYLRRHHDDERGVDIAIDSIKNMLRLRTLALDPDLQPYIRIAALRRLDHTSDDTRIHIARTEYDPSVAIFAIMSLKDKSRAHEALDSVHEVVKLHIMSGNIAA